MLKAARKNVETQEVQEKGNSKSTRPAVIKWKGAEHPVDPARLELERLIKEGAELTARVEAFKAKLEQVKEKILPYLRQAAGSKKSATLQGIAGICEYTLRQDLKIADITALKTIFGERLGEYAESVTTYKPTRKLRNAVIDGDHPAAEDLRGAVELRQSEGVRFLPRQ